MGWSWIRDLGRTTWDWAEGVWEEVMGAKGFSSRERKVPRSRVRRLLFLVVRGFGGMASGRVGDWGGIVGELDWESDDGGEWPLKVSWGSGVGCASGSGLAWVEAELVTDCRVGFWKSAACCAEAFWAASSPWMRSTNSRANLCCARRLEGSFLCLSHNESILFKGMNVNSLR